VTVEGPAYSSRPWLKNYGGLPADMEADVPELAGALWTAAEERPDAVAVQDWERGAITYSELAGDADALSWALAERGLGPGLRLAVMLQNVPEYLSLQFAAWRLGAILVPLNPMWKAREVAYHLRDSGASGVVHGTDVRAEVEAALGKVPTSFILDGDAVQRLAREHRGRSVRPVQVRPEDPAFLTYTSGTTGDPKGAINTHGNVAYSATMYRRWMALSPEDVNLGAAPICHITGLIAGIAVSVLARMPLVLIGRFNADRALEAIERYRVTFTVAAFTAYLALLERPGLAGRRLGGLCKAYSGGAPVNPAVVEKFEAATGAYIHPIYGLTETTSPSHATPLGTRAPVDAETGAIACGVPLPSTHCRVVDIESREEVPPGQVGELAIRGPMVVPGYWNRPDATEHTLPGGWLHTGDVGKMDSEGWFYIVDRAKDMINAAGYKVWPREVEDVLYQHPAVREVAVVGVPDDYRGETVKAFVTLREPVAERDLIEFCKARMAAYKYPRLVEVVDELPKTTTGKLLRRALRSRG
jgi:long-chain acyl-CoA synthetase